MKKTVLHSALFAFTLPMSLYALGLGEMKVDSALDQPFRAEIELIDIGSASLGTIRVGLADPENFERIGIERIAVLSLLKFKIEKNEQGKFVIKIQSQERMTEPYMELIVDLAWPNGQLYKAYTVLLDPPGYQLLSSNQQNYPTQYQQTSGTRHEAGVVNKTIISTVDHNPVELLDSKNKTTYGPTITNENVWQIAQRYKTSEVILPQVVLAIVGANPEAFTDGNLNGLKVGVRLIIPATRDIQQVPADLATQEVMAHDTAWNDKTPINHVIPPPYMGYQAPKMNEPELNSELPAAPKFTKTVAPSLNSLSQLINVNSFIQVDKKAQPKPAKMQQTDVRESTTKAEIAITTAAVESVRESNALLMEQLRLIQAQNKKLQQQLDNREKDIELIRTQLQVMTKERQAIASQASSSSEKSDASSLWPLFILFVGACGGGGTAFWYLRRRDQEGDNASYPTTKLIEPKPFIPEIKEIQKVVDAQPVAIITDESNSEVTNKAKDNTQQDSEVDAEPVKSKTTKKKKTRSTKSDPSLELGTVSKDQDNPIEEKQTAESQDLTKDLTPLEFAQHIDSQPTDEIIEIQTQSTETNTNSIENEPMDSIKVTHINIEDKQSAESKDSIDELADLEFKPHILSQPTEELREIQSLPIEAKLNSVENELMDSLKVGHRINEENNSPQPEDSVEELADLEFEPHLESQPIDEQAEVQSIPTEAKINSDESELMGLLKAGHGVVEEKNDDSVEELPDLEFELPIETQSTDNLTEVNISSVESELMDSLKTDDTNQDEEKPLDMLEFESGLHHLVQEEPAQKPEAQKEGDAEEGAEDILKSLDFSSSVATDASKEKQEEPIEDPVTSESDLTMTDFLTEPTEEADVEENNDSDEFKIDTAEFKNIISSSTSMNPLKSSKALDTLLSLAKTYIGMDDFESARHSLDEVVEHGNETQKEEAKLLLEELKDKK